MSKELRKIEHFKTINKSKNSQGVGRQDESLID